jgi:cardiolipin synthase
VETTAPRSARWRTSEAGVKIFETHDLVLHSKTVVVDGVWSAVGSSNFDHRSVISNDEVDAVVLGAETANELEAMAQDDRAAAHAIDRNFGPGDR